MQIFNITLKSKNRNSLEKFYQFFNRNTFRNLKLIKKFFQKKSTKKVITLLTSPHVNKVAQEQFELKIFKMQYRIRTAQTLKFLIFMKRIKTHLFPDVSVKLQKVSNELKQKSYNKTLFNTDSYTQKHLKTFKSNSLIIETAYNKKMFFFSKKNLQSKFLLKLLDIYGK